MQQLTAGSNWSVIINILMAKYFANLTSTCILWPKDFELDLNISAESNCVVLQISSTFLNESFEDNIYNFTKREAEDHENNIYYNPLTKKLIAAIEQTHCEGFLAFQDDIPKLVQAFQKASLYSIWRSMNNRFLFAFSRDQQKENYFKDVLFKNQVNILIVAANNKHSSVFDLTTNKFVGPSSEHPEQLIHLSTFYATNRTFVPDLDLFLNQKVFNLQGREIVVGAFDYRPFVAVDFQRLPLFHDHASDNPSALVHVDGAEIRICHIFCELYNCTLQFDTSEKQEWGLTFANYSAIGLIGMILEGRIEMAFGAIYALHSYYVLTDMTAYLGRSGVTCLVPAASAVTSWDLPLRPFKFSLWLAVLACLCLETIVLFAARRFEEQVSGHKTTWWSWLEFGYTTTLKLFINQSSHYSVQLQTVRTFLLACYMFDIILTSIYGGGLSAVLTLPTFGESADSVEKLVKYNLTWTGTSYAWLESINETQGDEQSIYKRLIDNFEVNTVDEMRAKAKTATMAFIVERASFGHFGGSDFITPQALQHLKLMVDDVYSQFTMAFVSRLWPYLERYNEFLLQWHSSGLDKYWEWKSTAEYLNINEQNQMEASKYTYFDRGPVKLNAQNFAGLIALWIAGMMLSTATFIVELLWSKWCLG